MSFLDDLKTLRHLVFSPIRGVSHAERLESFYEGQADGYDGFRARLLQGREDLFGAIDFPRDAVWADLGGGTGSSLTFMGRKLDRVGKGYIVDLSPSLLAKARSRIETLGCSHVRAVEADVTRFEPEEGALDVVTFSYSLTMMPEWFEAIDHACRLLKPGGVIGIVDFYVARKHPTNGHMRHGWWSRSLWPLWFANDNVFLSPDHVPYLESRFHRFFFSERRARVPYMLGRRVPYYLFLGRKQSVSSRSHKKE